MGTYKIYLPDIGEGIAEAEVCAALPPSHAHPSPTFHHTNEKPFLHGVSKTKLVRVTQKKFF